MGFPLEPLTAHDIGQAAGKKDHCQDQKKDIEHVKSPLQTWSSTQPCDRRFTVARSKSEGSQKKALQHQDFVKIDLPAVYPRPRSAHPPRLGRSSIAMDRI
jgi:hypothetical protein